MNTTLLNNDTKFRAKIFKPYRVITFLVLGHFLAAPCIPTPYASKCYFRIQYYKNTNYNQQQQLIP